ncbi:winged helix-turn-helix transcriptional regulator [Actinophytocola sp.]|uniref:winged helix-turn-helix transcriptional regulator n=1 Tax=Actinophytocola sp. TaxID=1872138 RepID=UPI002D806386|nr:winged helix-turn-helix transcriptional regulator [Actinophytocola sp.]HET9138959.1 winged helix-turn-helix transcriptional regulator [Actinophytocola sp.]
MTDAQWKLVFDQQGVTIASDKFQFTTNATRQQDDAGLDFEQQMAINSAESSYMEAVISQLQTMTRRTYGQYCGLSRAIEVVGERWSPMIIRDLLVRPKSFHELNQGFPSASTDILSARLGELEHSGVVRQVQDTDGETRYRLTAFGRDLDDAMIRLGRWGARLLGAPRPEDVATNDSVRMALRTMFDPEAAAGIQVSYQLNLDDIVVHARIDDGVIETGEGPLAGADLVLEPGETLMPMLTGELSAAEAIATGSLKYFGDPALVALFTELFKIDPMPVDS